MNAATMKVFVGAVALAVATVGCATETTISRPVSGPPSAGFQAPAAPYPIPAVDPKGTIYVMSFGGEPMPTRSGCEPGRHSCAGHLCAELDRWSGAHPDPGTTWHLGYLLSAACPGQSGPGNLVLAGSPRERTRHRDHAIRAGAEPVTRVRRLPARWCRG